MYLINTYITIINAIAVSIRRALLNKLFLPITPNTPFVASALMTNGNVNAEKLG